MAFGRTDVPTPPGTTLPLTNYRKASATAFCVIVGPALIDPAPEIHNVQRADAVLLNEISKLRDRDTDIFLITIDQHKGWEAFFLQRLPYLECG